MMSDANNEQKFLLTESQLEQLMADVASKVSMLYVGKDHITDYVSNTNLLDNWYFVDPINQKGKQEYTDAGYAIDRWHIRGHENTNNKLVLTAEGIKLMGLDMLQHIIDPECMDLTPGTTYTMSYLHKGGSSSGMFIRKLKTSDGVDGVWQYINCRNGADVNDENGWTLTSYTFDIPENALEICFNVWIEDTISEDIYKAAKLEFGPVQTLAHKKSGKWVLNDPPPNKALELAKCQRYMINLTPPYSNAYTHFGIGTAFYYNANAGTTSVRIFVPVPVQLRIKPAFIYDGELRISFGGWNNGGLSISNIEVLYNTTNGVMMEATVNDKLTIGTPYHLCGYQTSFILDANL